MTRRRLFSPVRIPLTQYHIELSKKVGTWRQDYAVELNRKAHNGAPTDYEKALALHIHGALCECAGWLFLEPITWHQFVKDKDISGLPDLGTFIDVKGIDNPDYRLIVQIIDPEEWAYLLISSHDHPVYTIYGWLCGGEVQRYPIKDPTGKGRDAYFVEQKYLADPQELREIVNSIRSKESRVPSSLKVDDSKVQVIKGGVNA